MTVTCSLLRYQQALLVGQVTWAVAVTFIRASILALYIRIFRTKSFRMTCYVVHGINAAFGAATILGACLICLPIAFNWDRSIPGGYCGDQKSLDLFIGVFNLLMDVIVVVLPMPVLWDLQMAAGKKVRIGGMFGLGIMYVQTPSSSLHSILIPLSAKLRPNKDLEYALSHSFASALQVVCGTFCGYLFLFETAFGVARHVTGANHRFSPQTCHNSNQHLRIGKLTRKSASEPRHQRPADLLADRPLHMPRSSPRRHQRLPSRPETRFQQTRRLICLGMALVCHVREHSHLHAPKPDGLEMGDSLGDEERLGNGERDAGNASVAWESWRGTYDVTAAQICG